MPVNTTVRRTSSSAWHPSHCTRTGYLSSEPAASMAAFASRIRLWALSVPHTAAVSRSKDWATWHNLGLRPVQECHSY